MRAFLALVIVLWSANVGKASTNAALPFRTNFVHGAGLSFTELETVVKLANLCGIHSVTEVSTELHLSGATIRIAGDEKIEGRSVAFETLLVYGKENRRARPANAPSVGEFWAATAKPRQEERTIVRIGNQKALVGLLNGIKPDGADRIINAFVKGRVRLGADTLKDALSGVDVTQPTWIGISEGKLWITFSSRFARFIFTLDGDEVTLVERVQMYE